MYLYFIKAFRQEPMVKIGYSKEPHSRLSKLQVGSPVKLKLMGTIRCKDESHAKSLEKLAHNIFYKQRRRGEWFKLSETHRKQIESLIQKCSERHEMADTEWMLDMQLLREMPVF